MSLFTLEDQVAGMMAATPGVSACELLAIAYWPDYPKRGLPTETAKAPVLPAVVNHGRWVVSCPTCQSANRASFADRRFLCCECGNVEHGGKWLPVAFPDDSAGIDRALSRRLLRRDRNWLPGETAADLEKETDALAEAGLIKVTA